VEVEHVDFISVPVTDMERSKRFYADTLGLPFAKDDSAFPEFKLGDNVFLYLVDPRNTESSFKAPHNSPIALRVADVAEAHKELEAKGVVFEFKDSPFDTGVCHMAIFKDPDGNQFMLHRRYAPHES
jgi:catechol 2,3-dioxygenase-like lactoylglutathione lyase family enzyme